MWKYEGFWFGSKSMNDEQEKEYLASMNQEQKEPVFVYVRRPAINMNELSNCLETNDLKNWQWWQEARDYLYNIGGNGSIFSVVVDDYHLNIKDYPEYAVIGIFCSFFEAGFFPPEWVLREIYLRFAKWLSTYQNESPSLLDDFFAPPPSTNKIALSKKIKKRRLYNVVFKQIKALHLLGEISLGDILGLSKNGIDLTEHWRKLLKTTSENLEKEYKIWSKHKQIYPNLSRWMKLGIRHNSLHDSLHDPFNGETTNKEFWGNAIIPPHYKKDILRNALLNSLHSQNNEMKILFLDKYRHLKEYFSNSD